jgi:bifunctional non-homologous end joining protein LigD
VSLDKYRSKRDFTRTPEPSGEPIGSTRPAAGGAATAVATRVGGRFVVQRHRARALHYDFRLEIDGALASWAIPKGPTLDPTLRRAAFHVEDHPLDYYDFEGTIPRGEYGAGDVIVWDWGTFEPEATDDPGAAVRDGELKLVLHGEKLRGRYTLVRTKGYSGDGSRGGGESARESWLLIKKRDDSAVSGWDVEAHPLSVKTGRTNDEVVQGVPARTLSASPALEHTAADAEAVGTPGKMPDFIDPMKATLADRAFSNPAWLYELKWDGYRIQAHVRNGQVALFSRRGLDAVSQFPELAGPPSWLAADEAILDGEVVALDADGQPSFGLLQARNRGSKSSGRDTGPTIVYQVFDLLYLDGRSLLDLPLVERKRVLRSVLRGSGRVKYAGHIEGDGEAFYEAVAARGLEGVVAKLRASKYEPGRRSSAWLKIKRRSEQEFAVGGWTTRDGDSKDLAALLLGVYEGGQLRPVGKAGTGFDARARLKLMESLEPLSRPTAPFSPVPNEKRVHWVEPSLVVRVEFAEWTADGHLRAASFKGVDLDVDPRHVTRERPLPTPELVATVASASSPSTASTAAAGSAETGSSEAGGDRGAPTAATRSMAASLLPGPEPALSSAAHATPGVEAVSDDELDALDGLPGKGGIWTVGGRTLKLSNLDKVLWPDDGITKRELIRYFVSIGPYLLPYLEGRALTLQRYPDGVSRIGFWQKQIPGHAPDWIDRWPWPTASKGQPTEYLVADSVATLAWCANEAAIDVHPSTFRLKNPQTPTWALIDIDPGLKTSWEDVLLFARLYRTALEHLKVTGFPKVTGQRGIQVWVPIAPKYTFDQTRDWVAALSRTVAAATPGMVSWEWSKSQREGLARLDYTQNAWNKTLVAPYSVRPARGAPVSAPISWGELEDPDLRPDRWTIRTILERIAQRGDLFSAALSMPQDLPSL